MVHALARKHFFLNMQAVMYMHYTETREQLIYFYSLLYCLKSFFAIFSVVYSACALFVKSLQHARFFSVIYGIGIKLLGLRMFIW